MGLFNNKKKDEEVFNQRVQSLVEDIKKEAYKGQALTAQGLNSSIESYAIQEKAQALDAYLVSSPEPLQYKTQALILSMKDEKRQPLDLAREMAGTFFTADNTFGKKTMDYLAALEVKVETSKMNEKDALSAKNNVAFVCNVIDLYIEENKNKMDSSNLSFLRKIEGQLRSINDTLSETFPEQRSNFSPEVFNKTIATIESSQLAISTKAIQNVVVNQNAIDVLLKDGVIQKAGVSASIVDMNEVKSLFNASMKSFENVFQFDKGLIARMDKELIGDILGNMNKQAGLIAEYYPQEEYVNNFVSNKINKFAQNFDIDLGMKLPVQTSTTQVMSAEEFESLREKAFEHLVRAQAVKETTAAILAEPIAEKPNDWKQTQIMAGPVGVIKGSFDTPSLLQVQGIEGLTVIEEIPPLDPFRPAIQKDVPPPRPDPAVVFATLDDLVKLTDLPSLKDKIVHAKRNDTFSKVGDELTSVPIKAVDQNGINFEADSSLGKLAIQPIKRFEGVSSAEIFSNMNLIQKVAQQRVEINEMPTSMRSLIVKSHVPEIKTPGVVESAPKSELKETTIDLPGVEGSLARMQRTREQFAATNLKNKINALPM